MIIASESIFNLISVYKTLKNMSKEIIRPGKNPRILSPWSGPSGDITLRF